MKRIFLAAGSFLTLTFATNAQQKEGMVVYERTMQMQMRFSGGNEELERLIPRTRVDRFELHFGKNQVLYKAVEQENEEEHNMGEGGVQIRMVAQGSNDVLYSNLESGKRVEQRDFMEQKFIIDDSIRPLKWKMTGETKSILNHNCMKAIATQISQRTQMTMDNGQMERKEVSDTSIIEAWFASDIPVSAGPGEFVGQLPGLILEMNVANGRAVYKAIALNEKADLALIKEPAGKKRLTQEEFRKERDKMMDEMQKNNQGGGRRIIRMN